MRIAIPSDDGNNFAAHTGRAQGFIIYDVNNGKSDKVEYRDNRYTGHALGLHNTGDGHGQHHSHNSLLNALSDCQIMLAHGMGPRLVDDLDANGIQVVFCRETDADLAAQKFAQDILIQADGSSCDHKH
ncbi:iron-molybdenum cofactor biosynthesis protein [bacterium]|nr:iron-molybdenum cofactor biosynthesis protein [bacterium]